MSPVISIIPVAWLKFGKSNVSISPASPTLEAGLFFASVSFILETTFNALFPVPSSTISAVPTLPAAAAALLGV